MKKCKIIIIKLLPHAHSILGCKSTSGRDTLDKKKYHKPSVQNLILAGGGSIISQKVASYQKVEKQNVLRQN